MDPGVFSISLAARAHRRSRERVLFGFLLTTGGGRILPPFTDDAFFPAFSLPCNDPLSRHRIRIALRMNQTLRIISKLRLFAGVAHESALISADHSQRQYTPMTSARLSGLVVASLIPGTLTVVAFHLLAPPARVWLGSGLAGEQIILPFRCSVAFGRIGDGFILFLSRRE